MSATKDAVVQLLEKLPEDCTLEDVQYHLYVLEKARRGEERTQLEAPLSQEQVEERMSKWVSK